jgi:hypothetical protein
MSATPDASKGSKAPFEPFEPSELARKIRVLDVSAMSPNIRSVGDDNLGSSGRTPVGWRTRDYERHIRRLKRLKSLF